MTKLVTEILIKYTVDIDNWQPVTIVSDRYPQFTPSQLNGLFRQRRLMPSLSCCYRRIGRQEYINVPLFGLWLSGLLPEQQMGKPKWINGILFQIVTFLRGVLILISLIGFYSWVLPLIFQVISCVIHNFELTQTWSQVTIISRWSMRAQLRRGVVDARRIRTGSPPYPGVDW